ncbi:MAG TPA: hypothetical protein VNT79_01790 [Phycisphaerae bacterium]|nr:hypothetical protein [Phycisphaerae bacterium]
MPVKTRRISAALVIAVPLMVCSHANTEEPAGAPNAQMNSAPLEYPIPEADLSNILDAAIETQRVLDRLSALCRLEYFENIARLSEKELAAHPNLSFNNGNVSATMQWWRDGDLERLDAHYDVPKKFMLQEYEDQITIKDSERQIIFICRTHQAAIVSPGPLRGRSPADWLLPGSRRGLKAFLDDERVQIQGFMSDADIVRVQISLWEKTIVNLYLSPNLDYAVTSWTSGDGRAYGMISYERDSVAARVVPRRAMFEVTGEDGTLIRRRTLTVESIVLGSPDSESFEFQMPPGSGVVDNRTELHGGKLKGYEVSESGELVEVALHSLATPSPATSGGLGLGAIGIGAVALAICLRIASAWMVQTRKRP